jgi:hypothetical protein
MVLDRPRRLHGAELVRLRGEIRELVRALGGRWAHAMFEQGPAV